MAMAFLSGGIICVFGQAPKDISYGMDDMTAQALSITLIFIAAFNRSWRL